MRKLVLFNLVTLDGYFEGPNGELDWHNVDDEFNEFAWKQLDSTDTLLFGRVTYQLMAGYWPTETAIKNDPVTARKMNEKAKFVFSKTIQSADWNNTKLVQSDVEGHVRKLKQEPGKDLILCGSANLGATLMEHNLIDEYRIMVNPMSWVKVIRFSRPLRASSI